MRQEYIYTVTLNLFIRFIFILYYIRFLILLNCFIYQNLALTENRQTKKRSMGEILVYLD